MILRWLEIDASHLGSLASSNSSASYYRIVARELRLDGELRTKNYQCLAPKFRIDSVGDAVSHTSSLHQHQVLQARTAFGPDRRENIVKSCRRLLTRQICLPREDWIAWPIENNIQNQVLQVCVAQSHDILVYMLEVGSQSRQRARQVRQSMAYHTLNSSPVKETAFPKGCWFADEGLILVERGDALRSSQCGLCTVEVRDIAAIRICQSSLLYRSQSIDTILSISAGIL